MELVMFVPSIPQHTTVGRSVSYAALIRALFRNNEPGIWLDPSDLSTLYQERTGASATTPAGIGDPVGTILDKSGNDNHATAPSDAARPILGRVPVTGRRNLLERTEEFESSRWRNGHISGGTRSSGNITITSSGGFAYHGQDLAVPAATFTVSVDVVCDQTINNVGIRALDGGPIGGQALVNFVAGVTQRVNLSVPSGGSDHLQIGIDCRTAVVPGSTAEFGFTVTFNRAQLEFGSTATPYQRVGSQFDVTEAGVRDAHYLSFDGIDDVLVTPTITPGTDKVQVFAGVRKLSDGGFSVAGFILETSPASGANNGNIYLAGPNASRRWDFRSKGTTAREALTTSAAFNAPVSSVLTGLGDISAPSVVLRANGTQLEQNDASQGTGDYLAYAAYIGGRGGTSLFFNGHIYALLVRFGPNLDTKEIERVEKAIARKTPGVDL